jgi:hypothetical protein
MNYDTIPAGKALDILIAEKLFGWTGIDKRWVEMGRTYATGWKGGDTSRGHSDVPNYSTDIAEAWKVFGAGFELMDLHNYGDADSNGLWKCSVIWSYKNKGWAEAETAPLAICRAALNAIGADK